MDIKLMLGDCLEELGKMESKSVSVSFYDPPYNVKKKYDGYNDNKPPEEYVQWMKDVYKECDRVSTNGVAVYVASKIFRDFVDVFPRTAHLIVVHKRAAGVRSNNYMLQYHLVYTTIRPVVKCRDLWNDIRLPGEGYFFREPRFDNPGLTGLSLTERFLHHFTKEEDVVLDPFCGTGTTLVACKNMNRNGVGIEQSKKYIGIAKQRLGIDQ